MLVLAVFGVVGTCFGCTVYTTMIITKVPAVETSLRHIVSKIVRLVRLVRCSENTQNNRHFLFSLAILFF